MMGGCGTNSSNDSKNLSFKTQRNILVAEAFLKSLKLYERDIVYSDGGTWYPEVCNSLGLKHRLHTPFEKSIIERSMEYVKNRTESFDDYYPCMNKEDFDCSISHVHKWIHQRHYKS